MNALSNELTVEIFIIDEDPGEGSDRSIVKVIDLDRAVIIL